MFSWSVVKTRHALEARLLEGVQHAHLCHGKLLVDYFYAKFSFSHQQATLLDRHEPTLRHMQAAAEEGLERLETHRSKLRHDAANLTP